MRALTSILLITVGDGRDQAAFELAHSIALRSRARLKVAAFLGSLPKDFQRVSLVIDPGELWKMAVRERTHYLNALVAGQTVTSGVDTHVLLGEAVDEIGREVSREGHDLVIVPGRQWTSHIPNWLRFDLPARLARRCHCPVWTVDRDNRDRAHGIAMQLPHEAAGTPGSSKPPVR
jgi:nucleotide-binding universal stress UspA family protein